MSGNDLFSRVQAAYQHAQTLDDDALGEFLQELAESDAQVADEVWGMLDSERRDAEEPAGDRPQSIDSKPRSTDGLPSRIAEFNIIDQLGAGDTGTVLLAEQHRPRRQVALKLVRPGLVSDRALGRVEFEAEELARLTHRGVASVYAVGEENGSPYFAMELVKGPPLEQYITEQRMKSRAKIELFIDICDAVQHAHAKGVLHLHIKPGNLRVDFEGFPKILDFGVARAIGSGAGPEGRPAQLIGDLAYMSPEQVTGDPRDVDSRSDVYAIGAVLYELLTGVRPVDTEGVPIVEAKQRITEEAPTPPSKHNPKLSKDIDAVLARALAKDPEERYQSAGELGGDLRRVIEKRPVTARKPTVRYLLNKCAARSLPATVLGGAAVAAVVLACGAAMVGYVQERTAADTYQQQAQLSKNVNRFLVEEVLGGVATGTTGDTNVTALELIDRAVGRTGRSVSMDPGAEAEVRSVLAQTYFSLGRFEASATQWRLALNRFDQTLNPSPEDAIMAIAGLGEALRAAEDFVGAEGALKNAAKRAQAAGIEESRAMLTVVHSLAEVKVAKGEHAEGIAMHEKNLAKRRTLLGAAHEDTLSSLYNLAMAKLAAGDTEGCEQMLNRCVGGRIETLGAEHPATITAMTAHAEALHKLGRLEAAQAVFASVLEANTRVLGPEHTETLSNRTSYAAILLERGETEEAVEQFDRVVSVQERVLGAEHPELADSLYSYASSLVRLERFAEAAAPAERAAVIRRATLDATNGVRIDSEILLAQVFRAVGRIVESDTILVRAIAAAEPSGPNSEGVKQLRVALEQQRLGE